MSNLSLCRVCLASNTRMHIITNTRYQEIFEKLSTKLCTEDKRPETLCFICYSQLQRCHKFIDMSRKAEEVLTQFSHSGIKLSEDTFTILDRKFVYKLSWTPLQSITINHEVGDCNANVEIKEEFIGPSLKLEAIDNNVASISSGDTLATGKITIKKEVDSDSDINETISGEQLTDTEDKLKEEKIKQELVEYEEVMFSTKFEFQDESDEKYYKGVGITNPTPDVPKHTCKHCDKAYKHKFHLNRHLQSCGSLGTVVLTGKFICELCGKNFTQKNTLLKHLRLHTGQRPYACNLCPARCSQKIDLDRHMRMHTGQKPFTCDICKMTFSRKSNMRYHILTHADDKVSKPFLCHICNNNFTRKYDLNRHMKRKHTKEKPYACDLCNFRSLNASYIKTHVDNKHVKQPGLKPFACSECDFKCGNAKYLIIHAEKKHNGKPQPKKPKIKMDF